MDTTEKYIVGVLNLLPEEGLDKLNKMIDDDAINKDSLVALLKEYNIDSLEAIKRINEAGA